MQPDENSELSRKRLKLSSPVPDCVEVTFEHTPANQTLSKVPAMAPSKMNIAVAEAKIQQQRERDVGISMYVGSGSSGFSGILKQRYTDFLVNEILPSGEVVHLNNYRIPKGRKLAEGARAKTVPSGFPDQAPGDKLGIIPSIGEEGKHGPANGSNDSVLLKTHGEGVTADESAKASSFRISNEDGELLRNYFGHDTTAAIVELYSKIVADPNGRKQTHGTITSSAIPDRQLRTKIHQDMRRIFCSKLETTTDGAGSMIIAEKSGQNQWGNNRERSSNNGPRCSTKSIWEERGGEYLHFSIYKENKDTMEVISYLARQLRLPPKTFQFAGTKDRRAVTVQRASAYRTSAEKLASVNRSLHGSKVGGFEYHPRGLELGELQGNEFVITLRDCEFGGAQDVHIEAKLDIAKNTLAKLASGIKTAGFINYYGLQRFGSFKVRTDTIGLKILQGDFKGACEDLLSFNPDIIATSRQDGDGSSTKMDLVSRDDRSRARAIQIFQATGQGKKALDELPRKFSAEAAIIRHLGGHMHSDYRGALMAIPRNLRLMYIHAYQALVWNFAASERIAKFGLEVVEGDLVLINKADATVHSAEEEYDDVGELVVHPDPHDLRPFRFERSRALSKDEVASGQYSIFDIVLPLPGYDVIYPPNEIGLFYKSFMGSEQRGGLDPHNMHRSWKESSLSGGYRKVLGRPLRDGLLEFEARSYVEEIEQMVETDLDKLDESKKARNAQSDRGEPTQEHGSVNPYGLVREDGTTDDNLRGTGSGVEKSKLAVILKFQLGTSQYATMMLRELMGPDGIQTYKPDFGGGR